MDRESLNYLLGSGKYLCFNPLDLEGEEAEDTDSISNCLFDSSILENSVFFKEVSEITSGGNFYSSTRVLLAFDTGKPDEGGPSFEVNPMSFEQVLYDWYGSADSTHLSEHDKNVLQVFTRSPTFDPFMLMAQRVHLERTRPIDDRYFAVNANASENVRSIISGKATQLVQLAVDSSFKKEQIETMVIALEDAIWFAKTNASTSQVFQTMGVPADQEDEVLIAWKGISYYEYMIQELAFDYKNMLSWFGSNDSIPNDIGLMSTSRFDSILSLRKDSKVILSDTYKTASSIIKSYHQSYGALIEKKDPKPFHQFLVKAPEHFSNLGSCVGVFGHANNAWKTLTNNGFLQKVNCESMEKFYRFVCNLTRN